MTIKRTGRPTARPDGTTLSGGAFAATQLDGPAAGLHPNASRTPEQLNSLIATSAEHLRNNREQVTGYDPAQTGHNAIYLAGIIKRKFPEAETVVFEERFTSDVNLEIKRIEGPEGVIDQNIEGSDLQDLIELEDLNASADYMVPYARGSESYLSQTGRDDDALKSEYSLNIERALSFGNDEALATHSDRGSAMMDHYAARFGDTNLEPEYVVADMLADIAHWAKKNGHDFDELVAHGASYAADEEDELT